MKTLLLLALLLASLLDSALAAPRFAAPATAVAAGPDRLSKMRRHLRHQAKVRLRQYRRQ